MENVDVVGDGLIYKTISLPVDYALKLLQWRRKNIESYLLCPKAIALAANVSKERVTDLIGTKHGIAISEDGYMGPNPPEAVLVCDGKQIFINPDFGIEKELGCNKYDVAEKMTESQICEDIKTFLTHVRVHLG